MPINPHSESVGMLETVAAGAVGVTALDADVAPEPTELVAATVKV